MPARPRCAGITTRAAKAISGIAERCIEMNFIEGPSPGPMQSRAASCRPDGRPRARGLTFRSARVKEVGDDECNKHDRRPVHESVLIRESSTLLERHARGNTSFA